VEERILVGGRRPGPNGGVVFDETAAKEGPGGYQRGAIERSFERGVGDRGRQRQSCTLDPVDNTEVGRHGAEEPSIEAPPGPRGARSGSLRGYRLGRSNWRLR
jgi:hypothetical protein